MFIPVLGHLSTGIKALLPESKANSLPERNNKVRREETPVNTSCSRWVKYVTYLKRRLSSFTIFNLAGLI
jgi:hypothetical protein